MNQKHNHPLNTLSASEIGDAVSILKKSNKEHENSSFSYITSVSYTHLTLPTIE